MSELADRCPECMPVTPEVPVRVSATRTGVRAVYRCGRCGHAWFTCWLVDEREQVA